MQWKLYPNLLFCFSSWWECCVVTVRLFFVLLRFFVTRNVQTLARGVAWAFAVKISISGLENLPKTPSVLLPLHNGLFDVVALLHISAKLRFAARSELLSWQWLGGLMRRMGVIEVNPEQPISSYRRLLSEVPQLVAANEHLLIFPQGSVCGIEIDFQQSAFRIAQKFKLPIVPIVLTGSHRVWDHPFFSHVHLGQEISIIVLKAQYNPDPTLLKRHMKQLALGLNILPRHYIPERDGFWDGYRLDIDPDYPEVNAKVREHRANLGK